MDDKEYLEEIKNCLTIEQVNDLLVELGADPQLKGNIIICSTICHNHPGEGSHKLYYFDNTHLFKCFTSCNDTFDIFNLISKVKENDGIVYSLPKALDFILNYYNLPRRNNYNFEEELRLEDWQVFNKYKKANQQKEKKIIEFGYYNPSILKYLPRPNIPMWEKENISKEIMDRCGICYDPSAQGIVIPHYDIDGKLIGIRERTLIKENEENGKYKPAILNGEIYNHPLGFNLYNLNNSKDNIKRMGKAIIFESEKSTLMYQTLFGIENDISVAVCGSSLTKFQVQLLLSLGVKEICIAFDRQYKDIGDDEFKKWTKKLIDLHKKYSPFVKVSFLFDKGNLIGYKSSPIDEGKDKFLQLYKERVFL